MKVILTEQQLDEMIRFEEVKNLLKSTISKYINAEKLELSKEDYEDIKKRISYSCKILGVTAVAIILINAPRWIKNAFSDAEGVSVEEVLSNEENEPEEEENNVYDQRVDELQNYMNAVAVLNGFKPTELKVSAADFINVCDKYDFDVLLAVAQAHQESCFGLKGNRCAETNSIFSVGLYDNGLNLVHFPDQKSSIEHYVKTMKKDYLNDKSTSDILSPNGFVNKNGHRYASDKNYEGKIKALYRRAKKNCPSLS